MKILNFGSLNYDYVYKVEKIVRAGETISSLGMDVFPGGKGLNQSVALAQAGVNVYHAGMIGEDGNLLLDTLKMFDVNTDYIVQMTGKNGHAIIQVDEKGQNSIILYGGSNQKNTEEYVNSVLSNFNGGDMLVVQNEVNNLSYTINKAYDTGMQVAMNPSPFNEIIRQCDLEKITYLFINEIEGGDLTGKVLPEEILKQLRAEYPKLKIILTMGKEGSWYTDEMQNIFQPAVKVDAVDTTAAGDTFTGYFLACMSLDMNVNKALEIAATAAAITVTRKGAAISIPDMQVVYQYLDKGIEKYVYRVDDNEFSQYARVVRNVDCSELLVNMENVIITDDINYVASNEFLENGSAFDAIRTNIFMGEDIQIGYCVGKNKKNSKMEYHQTKEVIIAATDIYVTLGKIQDINNDEMVKEKNLKTFMVPKGTVIEIAPKVLHYAPCAVDDEGYRSVIVLHKGTNTLLNDCENKGTDIHLSAHNKWIYDIKELY